MYAVFKPTNQILKRLGLDKKGRAQQILDASFISHMRRKMPRNSGLMIANTRQLRPGLIIVDVPYAHYMNEGIKYVMPHNGKSAYFSSSYGFWSEKGKKKIPSGESLNYHGGANRGAHFVERTINEDGDDIVRDIIEGMKL